MRKFIILLLLLFVRTGQASTIYDHDFNDGTFGSASHGSFWSIQNSGGIGGSAYARCTYSVAGTAGKAIIIPVSSYTTNTLWIEFYTRATSNIRGGSKFIKLFGYDQADGGNDSANNLTLGLDYNSNTNQRVAYFLDTLCIASWAGGNGFNPSKPEQLVCGDVLHPVTGGSIDIRGSDWDHYKVMVKRANPGQTNGEVKVWWNGNLHAHTTIMPSNPNYSITSPYIKRIEIGGYNSGQDGHFDGDTWYLDVDNLYVGTTEQDSSPTFYVQSTNPTNGSTGVTKNNPVGTGIIANKTFDCSTVSNITITPGSRTIACSGTSVTLTTSGQIDDTLYTVTVPATVKSSDGLSMTPYSFSYRTAVAPGTCASDPALCYTSSECTSAWPSYNFCIGEQLPCTPNDCTPNDYIVTGVSLNLSTVNNLASGSDNWPITEDSAGVQWTSWGDGPGFQGAATPRASIGVAKVVGTKDSYTGTDTWHSGIDYSGWGGKSKGILAVGDVENGGTLYLWRSGTGSDVQGFSLEQLYKSTDGGVTFVEAGGGTPVKWEPTDFSPTSPRFANCTFVQFGGGYDVANIPDAVEGYAYLSCPEVQQPTVWNVQFPGQVTMMRVPIGSIEDKSAYQWYSGSGPAWSSNKTDRIPIWSDTTNGVMRISETYVAGIDRYILIGQQVDRFTASDAHIGIYESETPWGPWSTVTFENAQAFGIAESGATKTVFWGISTKWSTGNDFVMVGTLPGQDEWGSVEGSFTILNLDVCSSVNWLLCDTDTKCEGVNKYWGEGACRSVKEKSLISTPNLMTNSHLITWQTESPNLPEDFVSYNTNVSRVSTGVRLFNGGIIAQETLIEPNSTYYYAYNCISSLGNVELWHYNTSHYSNTVGTISGIFTTPSSISDNRLYFKGLSDSTINHFVLKRILNNTDKSSRLKSTGIQVGIKSVGTPVNMVQ